MFIQNLVWHVIYYFIVLKLNHTFHIESTYSISSKTPFLQGQISKKTHIVCKSSFEHSKPICTINISLSIFKNIKEFYTCKYINEF